MSDFTALIPSNAVELSGERLVTTSLIVADVFGKRHDHVLRDIELLKLDCPADFNAPNFGAVEYVDAKGERRPMVELTKDGFTLLAMGYRGKRAVAFKIAYIERFNAMEAQINGAPRRDSEWVTVRRDDLWTLTTSMATLNVLLERGMGSLAEIERTTGEHWYGRPRPLTQPATATATPARQPEYFDPVTIIDPDQVLAFVADKRQVTTADVCAGIGADYNKANQTTIGNMLRAHGWTKDKQRRIAGKPVRVYFR